MGKFALFAGQGWANLRMVLGQKRSQQVTYPEVGTRPFPIGTRVRLKQDTGEYPTFAFGRQVPAGSTGSVAEYLNEGEMVMVRLDDHFPELEEWDNCLEISDWNRLNNSEGDDRIEDQIEDIETYRERTLAAMTGELEIWCLAQGLPQLAADDLLADDDLNDEQRTWLNAFVERWDATARME